MKSDQSVCNTSRERERETYTSKAHNAKGLLLTCLDHHNFPCLQAHLGSQDSRSALVKFLMNWSMRSAKVRNYKNSFCLELVGVACSSRRLKVANNWVFERMMQRMIPAFQPNLLVATSFLSMTPNLGHIFSKHFLLHVAPASCWPTAGSDPPPWTNRATQCMPAIVSIKSNQFLFCNHQNASKSADFPWDQLPKLESGSLQGRVSAGVARLSRVNRNSNISTTSSKTRQNYRHSFWKKRSSQGCQQHQELPKQTGP